MNLVPRQTAELEGPALDWAVAHATKAWEWAHEWFPTMTLDATFRGVSDDTETYGCVVLLPRNPMRQDFQEFCPAREWAYGGRLIEKYGVSVLRCDDDYGVDSKGFCNNVRIPVWAAVTGQHTSCSSTEHQTHDEMYQVDVDGVVYGPTALIAACRAIVAMHFGTTMQIPEGLLNNNKDK